MPTSDDEVAPDVTVRGPGDEPEVIIVGGVHGDEPSGVATVRALRIADQDQCGERDLGHVGARRPSRITVAPILRGPGRPVVARPARAGYSSNAASVS
jgi:ribosome biogenesis SPOUT family RNA methylase Rps3